MKVSQHDGSDMRRVLAAMCTQTPICARIASQWRPEGLFDAPWANLVAGWCVRYLEKYGSCPNGQLTAIFEGWAAKHQGEGDTVRSVERFMQLLSDTAQADDGNASVDYLLDVSARYFNKVRIQRTIEAAQIDLDDGQVEEADKRLAQSTRVELGLGAMVKPPLDYDIWRAAFDDDERIKPMISYPQGLGLFFDDVLQRGTLFSFMAPDKVGKSFWLLDLAFRAVRSRCRVAFIDAGDMNQEDILRRLGQRAARRPRRPRLVQLPKSVTHEGEVEFEEKQLEGLTAADAYKAFKRACGDGDLFRLACYPNSSMSVSGIDGLLADWERSEDWRPDVLVVDYADILAPPTGFRDPLEQIDETWKQLRRLSQARHCLVVTATQANAESYRKGESAGVLTRRNFSGRKTKLAHVNGMIGINQTSAEKKVGVCRLNWVVRRNGEFSERKVVTVAGCLHVAYPSIHSVF